MKKEYFDAEYPARDGRDTIPQDEAIARLAASILYGQDDTIWHARRQGIEIPTANKSARIQARRRCGAGHWVEVRGSAEFFAAVEKFAAELAELDAVVAEELDFLEAEAASGAYDPK